MGNVVDVFGIGESLSLYDYADNIRIGVNDICSRVRVDAVVCVDKKSAFTPERLKVIENSRCLGFFSQIKEWESHPKFKRIELISGGTSGMDMNKGIYKSVFSPYVAIGVAYKYYKPEHIRIFGVDMVSHPNLFMMKDNILRDWENMKIALKSNNITFEVFGDGILT